MSVPFSNTTLRIPRGFGNLLEGLSREVLRQQPHDIIAFAAFYFEDLLEKRTVSGIDPADWAAQLEDRFYNNHIFKTIRTKIPEGEAKVPPVTIDTAYKEKDISVTTKPESPEDTSMKCIKVPKDLSFISKQTISMILQEREKEGWSPKLAPKLDDTASPTTQEPEISPREDKSPQIIEAAPEEGSWEAMAPLMIEAAPEEGPSEDTAPLMIEAAPEEGPWEDTASVMIEATPDEGPSEHTAPLMVEAAPEQGPSEDTDSLMIEAAPEEDLTMETAPTEEAIEQVQSPEELPVMDNEEETRNPAEQQAAVIIQSTYRGYSTRKKLKEESPRPTEADNDLFTEHYPGTDGSEYNSGEELTFAEDKNVSFGKATGVSHEEPKSRLEGNVSAAKVDTAQVNICAAELGSLMEKVNFNMDVDICGSELQPDTKEDMTTETAGQNICGTELDQKDFFEATSHDAANVDICSTELESFATGKDTGDKTNEGTEIDIEAHGELGDEVTEEAVHHYEVGVSGTEENTQDQVNESQKSTKDIKEETKLMADTKDNDNPPTAENQDAEGDSSMIE